MELTDRKEILYYYESRQNPNGDPGFENQPRLMPDGTIMVTDVRIKRTIRDYAKNMHKKMLFVDFGEKGLPVQSDARAKETVGELTPKNLEKLLTKTFDTPLFGALVTIHGKDREKNENKDDKSGGNSFKVTGPVQFGLGRSVNQVDIVNPSITGRFQGADKAKGFSTIGKFYSVDYALLKISGAINPANLSDYWDDTAVQKSFDESEALLFDCLWNGTNNLITRSKYPQRSIFFIEVTYDGAIYNDLSLLVSESETMKGKTTTLAADTFDFSRLLDTLKNRKKAIKQVRIAACDDIKKEASELTKTLVQMGIKTEELR